MCGIAGATRTEAPWLAAMVERLHHRGPDDSGTWIDEACGLGLGHARLAVIDLSPLGHQPMASLCGRYVIAFNGEIYNYRELRSELEAAGESFRSHSDTEVLLALLRRQGTKALGRLAGMFAFALWDREARELLLVRDRFGVKPLVYAPLANGQLAFASEIRALAGFPGVDLGRDREALSEYLACLYVPAPRTLFSGIRKLPPGSLLRWKDGAFTMERWWAPAYTGDRAMGFEQAVEEVVPLVRRAVLDRMVADVPVGCFLSGGIDSSVIAALMAEETRRAGGPPLASFTMTFDEVAYDERDAAGAVARHVGSVHTELAASSRFVERLEPMIEAFGEPFGNPTALLIDDLSRKARQHVTVALVGDGGDEVFAGYPRYQGGLLAGRYRRLVPSWLRDGVIAPLAGFIPESSRGRHSLRRAREFLQGAGLPADQMYAAWVEYFDPGERRALLGLAGDPGRPLAAFYQAAVSDDPLDAMQQTDLESFLPGNLLAYGDAMSMAHALETRMPFLDHRLVEAVARIPASVRFAHGKKSLLKGVASRLLPSHIVERPKLGFNPPLGVWLKTDLADMIDQRLSPERLVDLGLDPAPVRRLIAEQRGGMRDHSLKIWSLLVLEAWDRQAAHWG